MAQVPRVVSPDVKRGSLSLGASRCCALLVILSRGTPGSFTATPLCKGVEPMESLTSFGGIVSSSSSLVKIPL